MEKEVSFFDVEAWSKLAESCRSMGYKGRGVRVVGRLKQDRWSDTEGKNHSKVSIIAEHVEFRPDFKKDGASDEQNGHVSEMEKALELHHKEPTF
jgi:single-strand DNA-binding protein